VLLLLLVLVIVLLLLLHVYVCLQCVMQHTHQLHQLLILTLQAAAARCQLLLLTHQA
jgi:hypothetical protein